MQEEADKKRRADFKRYEMEKKFEHEQRLQHIEDEEKRKEEERRMMEQVGFQSFSRKSCTKLKEIKKNIFLQLLGAFTKQLFLQNG